MRILINLRSINLCALLLTFSFVLSACSDPPPAPETPQLVKALELGDSDGLSEASVPGRAEAAQEAALSFRVGGQVEELRVDVGDMVAQGDVLAVLDQTDFSNVLKIAEGTLAEAQAAL
ncbi:MAG: biotin/lipoyl-binding protein, partial [Gammaproteobacteria bacterium]|nr:biotin/lipoyl-binding protein [Gammaproteobacteria bacterium]